MRILIFAAVWVLLTAATGFAGADENDLSSAVFVAHHPPDFEYSAGEDWTAKYYSDYAISMLYEVNAMIPDGEFTTANNSAVWYVLVAFCDGEDKEWAGTQFGFGDYDANAFYLAESGACLPGALEVSSSGNWPGPNEGVAVAATTAPWTGRFEPIYWFAGYQYIGTAVIPISGYEIGDAYSNCQLGTSTFPSETYEITNEMYLGAMGVGTPGIVPECGITWNDVVTWGDMKTLYK